MQIAKNYVHRCTIFNVAQFNPHKNAGRYLQVECTVCTIFCTVVQMVQSAFRIICTTPPSPYVVGGVRGAAVRGLGAVHFAKTNELRKPRAQHAYFYQLVENCKNPFHVNFCK